MNIRRVLRLLGRLLVLLALTQLAPLVWTLWYGEDSATRAFLLSSGSTLALGLLLQWVPMRDPTMYRREGILFVVSAWVLASVLGGLPFVLSGEIPDFVDALFESASGFTTTGATILTDIEAVGRGVLFWRSLTQWLGGLGIVVLFVALLPELGPGVRFLYRTEVPGPTAELLHARVRETATVLLKIYVGLSALLALLLMACGLSFYDALVHTLTTLSTGGFSPHSASMAEFSALVQVIVLVFMVIAGVNFSLLYELRRRRWGVWRDRELLTYLGLLVGVSLLAMVELYRTGMRLDQSALESFFQVTSLMTTTGYATADFDQWPDNTRALLLLVMLVGGSAGSTAGGIKVIRVLVGFRAALREVRLVFKPQAVIPITLRGSLVPDDVTGSVVAFILLFFLTLVVGTLALATGGADLITATTAALATLGNIGPGLGAVGPLQNFADFNSVEKLILVALMWLGRLEIMAIAALATAAFWRR